MALVRICLLAFVLIGCKDGPPDAFENKPLADASWVIAVDQEEAWGGRLYKATAPIDLPDGSRIVCVGSYKGGIWCKEARDGVR